MQVQNEATPAPISGILILLEILSTLRSGSETNTSVTKAVKKCILRSVLRIRIRDWCFLTHGSNPWALYRVTIFGQKYLNSLSIDLNLFLCFTCLLKKLNIFNMVRRLIISHLLVWVVVGSGINIPNPQHCLRYGTREELLYTVTLLLLINCNKQATELNTYIRL